MRGMDETLAPDEPRKIHGDKLAAAFRTRPDEVADMKRHPASDRKVPDRTTGGWVSVGRRADIDGA